VHMDEHRPFWEVSDEPEQSQHHEEEDEQQQAVPRSGLGLRAIDPVKFHRRVPHSFQPLHEGAHPRVPFAGGTPPGGHRPPGPAPPPTRGGHQGYSPYRRSFSLGQSGGGVGVVPAPRPPPGATIFQDPWGRRIHHFRSWETFS
jgi:hypothetical protein